MKKAAFLSRLHKNGIIKIEEPNDDVAKAYFQKASKSLSSAKALLPLGNLEDAIALSYYAMYHSLLALLFKVGIKCENHTASIMLLQELFGLDNTTIKKAKAERIDKQYYVDFSITKKEVKEAINVAEQFMVSIKDFSDKMMNDDVSRYHTRSLDLVKSA